MLINVKVFREKQVPFNIKAKILKAYGVILLFLSASCGFAEASPSPLVVKHLSNLSALDGHRNYYISALQLAFEKSEEKYGSVVLQPEKINMRQGRQFIGLDSKLIDVLWTATSTEREKQALPIRIPLLKGLIGHRVLVIRKSDASRFDSITNFAELSKQLAVQGHDWPDLTILAHAGMRVEKGIRGSSLYKLVSEGIVDYFPRSVLEVLDELEQVSDSQLIIDQRHLLIYPSAMYFFVRRGDQELAERIEYGLLRAIEDGSFEKNFLTYPAHARVLKTFDFERRIKHHLNNPLLPSVTPLEHQSLWFSSFEKPSTP